MKNVIRSRFHKDMDELALKFTSSIEFDRYLFEYEILVNKAHALSLLKEGHLSREDAIKILEHLEKLNEGEIKGGYEDIHEAVEARLIEMIGEDTAGKLHTGRSRNDQIATCMRMLTRGLILEFLKENLALRKVFLQKAEEYHGDIMAGFTHLQFAQPTSLSHWIIAYHDIIERDFERGLEILDRVNLCPLGSSAFASTGFTLDREFTAELLGFNGILENTMDAVSSRDFIIESLFLSVSSMLNLSRIAEDIIVWSSETGYIDLPEEFASTSSIMPQKKNPDVAELIRARTGTITGHLIAVITTYKALPFSYNRDLQEMNPHILGLESATISLKVMKEMFSRIKFRKDVMREKAGKNYSTATEVADTLVRKCGIPFRTAHRIVGKLVADGMEISLSSIEKTSLEVAGISLKALGLEERDIMEAIDPEKAVEKRKNTGGPSREAVKKMMMARNERLKSDEEILASKIEKIEESVKRLETITRRVLNGG